jgi:hypothetical protein
MWLILDGRIESKKIMAISLSHGFCCWYSYQQNSLLAYLSMIGQGERPSRPCPSIAEEVEELRFILKKQ